ncbi:hypothetical protein I532_11554 [Brevibacillus borstelensis AK1]|uniref:Pesticidal crystal protein Cry1Aa domain-containing protein n=1 Tax=Brevibacillus borstelensis AK1 TaxID=1300222 RepID=M8DZ21_9BACL|nr:toxin Cry1Ac domain D-VI-related protein [Brevibacillus borstelensis]EMT52286.1 hypothetical protein I532_11554 [Brevibacillus borstelensis AK1]
MNKKLVLSVLSTAVLTSMAASAMALEPGFYVGGNVDKYYSPSALAGNFKVAVKEVLKQPTVYVDKDGKAANFVEALFADDINTVLKPATADMFEDDDYKIVGTDKVWNKKDEPWPLPGDLKVESVSAITKTKVEVKFNKAVDSVKVENFSIAGATVSAATLGDDKKTVTLTVSGLDYETEYTVSAKGILVDGKEVDLQDVKFKTPAVTDLYELELTTNAPGDQILADGIDNLVITAKLLDKVTGQVDTNADDVLIEFKSTYGNLGNPRVTVQKGVATVTLRSEFSKTDLVSKVDAQIIEASGDYKDLIGKVVGTKEVYFKLNIDPVNPDVKPVVVSAGSNEADRVTVNFDKDVLVKHFVQYDEKTKKFKVDEKGNALLLKDVSIKVTQPLEDEDRDSVKGKIEQQDGVDVVVKTVRGLKPVAGNSKALEVILDKETYLTDNKAVKVEFVQSSNIGPQTTKAEFILADARKPEPTSVVTQDLRTVKVKFSEPIAKAEAALDGGLTKIRDVEFGEFNQETLEDTRDVLTIHTADYLNAGVHSVQLSSIYDFAGLTDDKNISTSQTLDFNVNPDTSAPNASVGVESPEQFRLTFNKQIEGLSKANLKLQVAVKEADGTEKWVNVEETVDKYAKVPELDIDPVSASEYVVELLDDWTQIYDTKKTTKNYYNDKYRLFIPANTITNPANGKQNADIVLPLDDKIMRSIDTTSPAIVDITEISTGHYNVEMSKPVKLPGKDNKNIKLDTPSQSQTNGIPTPIIEFVGKDKDGNAVTIKGAYVDYTDKNRADKQFEVVPQPEANQDSPQEIVNKGGDINWTLVVRSISDDVGNTAETLTKNFVIEPDAVAEDVFMIKGKFADGKLYNGVKGYLNGTDKDTIVLTFTSGVKYTGNADNAVNIGNYTLDGENLPKGTSFEVVDADNNTKNGFETVIIILPDGTLSTSKHSNVITVSKSLVSYKGTKLTGDYAITFKPELGVEPTDKEAAQAVDSLIIALPANITLADEADVNAARTAFDALTPAQQELVKNKAILEAAEKKIADLKKDQDNAAANLKAAQDAVEALEKAIGTGKDLTKEADLVAAETALKDAEEKVAKVAAGQDKDYLAAKVTLAKKTVTDARAEFDKAQAEALKEATSAVSGLFKDDSKSSLATGVDQAAIDAAKAKVEALADSVAEKTDLLKDVKKAQDLLDADKNAAEKLEAAKKAVEELFEDYSTKAALAAGVDQAAIDAAKAKVEALDNSVAEKVDLLADVEAAQDLLTP